MARCSRRAPGAERVLDDPRRAGTPRPPRAREPGRAREHLGSRTARRAPRRSVWMKSSPPPPTRRATSARKTSPITSQLLVPLLPPWIRKVGGSTARRDAHRPAARRGEGRASRPRRTRARVRRGPAWRRARRRSRPTSDAPPRPTSAAPGARSASESRSSTNSARRGPGPAPRAPATPLDERARVDGVPTPGRRGGVFVGGAGRGERGSAVVIVRGPRNPRRSAGRQAIARRLSPRGASRLTERRPPAHIPSPVRADAGPGAAVEAAQGARAAESARAPSAGLRADRWSPSRSPSPSSRR